MEKGVPEWAMREAGPGDLSAARAAQKRGTLRITWPDRKALRGWAEQQGWPTPWLGFDGAFLSRMLEDEAGFDRAVREGGIGLRVPLEDYTISPEWLRELDRLYDEPAGWGGLVEELREIRRAVEAGVVVKVEGAGPMRSWQDFYGWAHGRYHVLEEGYDKWIGNDD